MVVEKGIEKALMIPSLLNCVLDVLACSRGSRVYMLGVLMCLCVYVLGVFTCLRAWRAYVFGMLGVLACVRACLL